MDRKEDYIAAVLKAMWEDGENMGDAEVAARVLTAAGFDGPGIVEKTQDPAVKQKLMDNTSAVVERGVFGIPTFFVGDEMFFGKERIGQVEEEVMASG